MVCKCSRFLFIYFEIRTHFYFDMTKKPEVASVSAGKRRK